MKTEMFSQTKKAFMFLDLTVLVILKLFTY